MIDSRAARRVARLRLVAAVATSASGDRQRTLDGNVPVELAAEVAQQTEHQLTIDSAVVQHSVRKFSDSTAVRSIDIMNINNFLIFMNSMVRSH